MKEHHNSGIVDDITVKVLALMEEKEKLEDENSRLREVIGELTSLISNIESALPSGLESWMSYEEYDALLERAYG